MFNGRQKSSGFTLIELLVVIAIIGLLSSIVLASVKSARTKARDVRRKADLRQMQLALELYFDSNRNYPPEAGWCDSSKGVTTTNCPGYSGNSWPSGGALGVEQQGFMSKLPIDPFNNANYYYFYEPVCNQTQFGVTCSGSGNCCAYLLGAILESSSDPDANPNCIYSSTSHNYCVSGGGAAPQ